MSAYGSDPGLNVQDVTGNGTEVDVATNLLNGDIRLSILWTQEILCPPMPPSKLPTLFAGQQHSPAASQVTQPRAE
ncbi:hypothetical protein ACIHJG_11025 [Streptomyces sp. NPDC052415]|uniref:hypothetical protein n=1 Tax=Streptomyces sp. NPDC052415 TaxID=3365690 RepID=UPI0037D6F619